MSHPSLVAKPQKKPDEPEELLESPYTLPNALTIARIIACPFLGYQIVQGDYVTATTLLFACGVSDWVRSSGDPRFRLTPAGRLSRSALGRKVRVGIYPRPSGGQDAHDDVGGDARVGWSLAR